MMMTGETTAEQHVHVPQPTTTLQEECSIDDSQTCVSNDENENNDSEPVKFPSAHDNGNAIVYNESALCSTDVTADIE